MPLLLYHDSSESLLDFICPTLSILLSILANTFRISLALRYLLVVSSSLGLWPPSASMAIATNRFLVIAFILLRLHPRQSCPPHRGYLGCPRLGFHEFAKFVWKLRTVKTLTKLIRTILNNIRVGQNLEWSNVERPIFRNFKITYIEIAKDELFDCFIYEFRFFFFNYLNTQSIW